MRINDAGLELIKSFEGCKLSAYHDIVGILTIGFGHTGDDVKPGMTITQEEADELLCKDLEAFEAGVAKALLVKVTPNQFAALVCFSYNVGLGNLKKSMLLRCINKNNSKDAADEFLKWAHAGGVQVAGLLRRRQAERALFIRE